MQNLWTIVLNLGLYLLFSFNNSVFDSIFNYPKPTGFDIQAQLLFFHIPKLILQSYLCNLWLSSFRLHSIQQVKTHLLSSFNNPVFDPIFNYPASINLNAQTNVFVNLLFSHPPIPGHNFLLQDTYIQFSTYSKTLRTFYSG